MKSFILLIAGFFAVPAAFSQSVILWKSEAPPAGLVTREDISIRLDDGKFSLELGDKTLDGAARANIHDKVTRTQTAADQQEVTVHESLRNIVFGIGTSKGQAKDQLGHLIGKKIIGVKTEGHWHFSLASGQKPEPAETNAMRQFAAYTEIMEGFGQLYGANSRSVGDVWKPDLAVLAQAELQLDADLKCKLEEVTMHDGVLSARVSVAGHLNAPIGDNGKLSIEITGSIWRNLPDMVDSEMELSGTFAYKGAFGGNATKKGNDAEIAAPLKIKRAVKVEKK